MEVLILIIYNLITLVLPVILFFVCLYVAVACIVRAVDEYKKQNRGR